MDDILAVLDALISSFEATVVYQGTQTDQITQKQAQVDDLTAKLSADDKVIASFKDKIGRLQSLAGQLKQAPPSVTPLPGQDGSTSDTTTTSVTATTAA